MKFIYQLTDNEKRELIENKSALANMVYDDMIESELDFISEQLNYIRDALRDYSIGSYNYNYLTVGNSIKFFDGLEKIQKYYCTLPDAMQPEIDRVLAARERFYEMSYNNSNYDLLDSWLDKKAQYFADYIADYFSRCLDPNRLDVISYFVEFYADERMDETYYINEAGVLCQTVTKIIA